MQWYDILILGGGPGGLSSALHLARDFPHLTSRVLVLEKARYPRPKPCAGGLLIDAEVILERLGLDVGTLPHADADVAHLDFAGRGMSVRMKGRHTLRIVRRDEFDAWLAGQARARGIEIREGVTVRNVQPRADHVIVETDGGTFAARAAVGADGSNGVTRRCVLPHEPVHTARVLEALTDVIAGGGALSGATPSPALRAGSGSEDEAAAPRNDTHATRAAYFDFFCVPRGIAGYTWDFPTQVRGRPMRCWGIYDTNILAGMPRPALKETLAAEMQRHGVDLHPLDWQGHPIRLFTPFNRLSVPRVLLVGDAAGVDPIFGEGISIALGYGALAARELGAAFERGDFSFRDCRWKLMRSALGRSLVVRWFLAQVLYQLRWTWFQRGFWRSMGWLVWPFSFVFVINWARGLPPHRIVKQDRQP